MSPSSTPVLAIAASRASLSPSLLLLLLLMLMLTPRTVGATEVTSCSCDAKSCALLEASLLEGYVSGLNASGLPLGDEEVSGNASLVPFGALPSDWTRLLLLQNSQPEGTPLRENLLRLSHLVLAAYFDSQERQDWTDHLVTDDHGRGGDAAAGPASEAKSEDQQAYNATSDSTGRKAGTRINASPIDVAAYNNGGNFSGGVEDSTTLTTTSHYSTLPATGANFNQTFSSDADNEAGGSKSNETSTLLLNDESSAANEVLHERSREELRWRLKNDNDTPTDDSASDESFSFEFNSTKSVEEFFASTEERSGLVDEFFATEGATVNETTEIPLVRSAEDSWASSEEDVPLTKSVEDFFATSGELSATPSRSVEEFFLSSEELGATPSRSVEDFFRSAEATTEDPAREGPMSRDSGERQKNGEDSMRTTTTMAHLISGEVVAGDRTTPGPPAAGGASAAENRTSDRPDDLFSESATTTQRRPGDDWNSTSTGSMEPASDGGDFPSTVRLRRSIPRYLRGEWSPTAATTAQPGSSDGARDSGEEDAKASPRNPRQRIVRRNKRRTRKRAGAEPNVEGQYTSFDARESGQALLAEERSAENSARSLQ